MPQKIAYIGAGRFTTYFIHHHLARHDVDLAAICDLDEDKARLASKRFGFRKVYTDFRSMLDNENPDAVFCVGGPRVHHPVGLEVLDRGYPLYVQKPPASTSAGTREMAELATRKGVVCHVGFNLRFSPAIRQAHAILGGDEFGEPQMGIFRYGLASTEDFTFNVIDQHCHIVDLAIHLMGPVNDVQVVRSSLADGRDYVMTVRFESGAVGTINCTSGQLFEKEFIYFEVTGRENLIHCHGGDELTWKRPFRQPWWKHPEPDYVYRHGGYGMDVMWEAFGYVGDVDNFLAAAAGREADFSPIQSTIGTMETCEEILRQVGTPATV